MAAIQLMSAVSYIDALHLHLSKLSHRFAPRGIIPRHLLLLLQILARATCCTSKILSKEFRHAHKTSLL